MKRRTISLAHIERLRAHRWRTAPQRQIIDERGALRLISDLGFLLLMPIAGSELPSIHAATRDSWAWWDWKQTLPGRKACYYAKLLRRRGTFVSWRWFPYFHAAYSPRQPYWRQYREGLLGRAEMQVLDLLADRGPLMTREIRLAFGPRSKQNTRRVKAILVELQRRFLICAAGGDTDGWSHHRWDLVDRWVPARWLLQGSRLSSADARARLLAKLAHNVVATTPADIAWVFGWERAEVSSLVSPLLARGELEEAFIPELDCQAIVSLAPPRGRRSRRSGGR